MNKFFTSAIDLAFRLVVCNCLTVNTTTAHFLFYFFPHFSIKNEISTRRQLQFQDRLVVESRSKYDLSWTSNLLSLVLVL